MTKRRNLDRERLEVYYTTILLAYRPIIQICAWILMLYALAALAIFKTAGLVALGLAIIFLLLSYSYQLTLYLAKFGAWIGTIWREN
jgi:hypothetical protein